MSTHYVGEIRLLPYSFAPVGWQLCDGSVLSISDYIALFNLIGTTYGGDGNSTFAVPDLRGRIPIHQGNGNGLTPRVIGELSGSESVTVISTQLPAHSHSFAATSNLAAINAPGNTVELGGLSTDTMYAGAVTANNIPLSSATISPAGGSQPHANLMPTLTASFCIAVDGIYPSQA
jgi:microcystin-dependent protein